MIRYINYIYFQFFIWGGGGGWGLYCLFYISVLLVAGWFYLSVMEIGPRDCNVDRQTSKVETVPPSVTKTNFSKFVYEMGI